MFNKNHKNWLEYHAIGIRQVEINKKYHFRGSEHRSQEDNLEFETLIKRMVQIIKEYDLEFPVEPCEVCGMSRSFFYDKTAQCMNIARCIKAPRAFGA